MFKSFLIAVLFSSSAFASAGTMDCSKTKGLFRTYSTYMTETGYIKPRGYLKFEESGKIDLYGTDTVTTGKYKVDGNGECKIAAFFEVFIPEQQNIVAYYNSEADVILWDGVWYYRTDNFN